MKKIETKDVNGKLNGYLIPIWSDLDYPEFQPSQVYLTVVAPQSVKGPHLHKVRRGMFACIKGNIRIVFRESDVYTTICVGDSYDIRNLVVIPPGVPCALYNDHPTEEAFVINMPSPAWNPLDPDEWPVEDWAPERVSLLIYTDNWPPFANNI